SHAQLDRLFARLGAHRSTSPRTPGPRYERDCPNELWHIDLKGPFHFRDDRGRPMHCHFVALVDDWSRFLVGIRAVPTLEAEAVVLQYAGYYNFHRLHGEIGWLTPAERYAGTPFTDRGFEHIPTLRGVAELLMDLLRAA